MQTPRKTALAGATAILIGLAAYASFRAYLSPTATPTASEHPLRRVTVANIGEYSIFNLIAEENGYFRDNGLNAQVDEYDSGATSMAALLSGKADFAIAADFVGVTNYFSRKDLRILTTVSDQDVWQVVADKSRGISTPADLKGKKIGVTRKTSGEYYLGRFLAFNGMGLKDVKIVDLAPPQMVEQLEGGQLDAVVIFEPNGYLLKQKMGDEAIEWSAQMNQRTTGLAYATASYIEAHPDLVRMYLQALLKAERYAGAHPREAQALVARSLGYDEAYMSYIWTKIDFKTGLHQDLLLAMEDEARWLIDNRLTDQTQVPNYLDAISFDGLEAVEPGSVTIIH